MRQDVLRYEFVEQFPDWPAEGTIYISIPFGNAMHRCCCGCGNQVITPLSPTGWRLIFDGKISLDPSIGNWSFPCQSHYWIIRNKVEWARRWSKDEIAAARGKVSHGTATPRRKGFLLNTFAHLRAVLAKLGNK